ncbi:Mitochondrial import inner membrane translocase subunit TIM16 [Hirsutella minnesotensis 3608]|nr:Mitochondrial import inner membrane translocase subunit TIM16 [Hirsutella minnesotensis 3608]
MVCSNSDAGIVKTVPKAQASFFPGTQVATGARSVNIWTLETDTFFVPQAHKFVITAFLTGSRILGRSFVAAYKQAQAASNYQRAHAKANGGSGASAGASLSSGMTLDEACRILNVKAPAEGRANVAEVLDRYKRLFDANDPQKGGSFYLQSKIVRAKERFERELGPIREQAEHEAEVKEGWKPKIYKDR